MLKDIFPNYFLLLLLLSTGLLFSPKTRASSECIAYLQYTQGYWQVWLMDENGQNKRQISQSKYDKSSLSWYPNAKYMLLNSIQGELYKVDVRTGKEVEINVGLKGMFDAVLSPDGQNISFGLSTSGSRDDHNIWHVDLKTKEILKLTNLKQMQHLPRWSADGKWVYFSSKTDDQHNDILRVQAQGEGKGKKTDAITVNALYNFDAIESLDHNIVFSSNRTGNYELWKLDSNNQLTQIT
ncbi:MAG TPA: hypothetical protein ENJ28_09665, partial [Gammaproteobacteria bacterium]|nr:hypothetical protein [Gammaproteobacteria bacterium]